MILVSWLTTGLVNLILKMQKQKSKNKDFKFVFVFLASLLFLILGENRLLAAELYFQAGTNQNLNQEFKVNFLLDTERKQINAIQGKILFPENMLQIMKIRDSDSISNFWVEKPKVEPGGAITFSGITPGGFNGSAGLVLSIIFRPKKTGQAEISIEGTKLLLNDGLGTETKARTLPFVFSIGETDGQLLGFSEVEDNIPPEVFTPEIARDPNILDGQWFVAFMAQDKSSDIARYEVKECRYPILSFLKKFKNAESPFILEDQEARSYVFVKAVDNSGNERVVKLKPSFPFWWYEKGLYVGIISLLLALSLRKVINVWRKKITK